MLNYITKYPLLEFSAVFLIVLATRLPYLLSSHVYFDGDEAMIGIMARDLMNGERIPCFFYGQQYGFSLFEVISCAFFLPFFGSELISLKLGGILLFSIGVWRLLKLLSSQGLSKTYSFLLILLTCLLPAWIVWSTKLRGGYITAFVATCFVFELLLSKKEMRTRQFILLGLLISVILFSQGTFILLVMPLVVYRLVKSYEWKSVVTLIASSGFAAVSLFMLSRLNSSIWSPQHLGLFDPKKLSTLFCSGFFSHSSGFYSYSDIYETTPLVKLGLIILTITTLTQVIYVLIAGSGHVKKVTTLLLIGTFAIIPFLPWMGIGGGRYLLGFHVGWMMLFLNSSWNLIKLKKTLAHITIFASLIGGLLGSSGFNQFVSFWHSPEVNDMKAIEELIMEIENSEVRHVLVSEWNLEWQINYLGTENINARSRDKSSRMNRFRDRVDSCYQDEQCEVALVGSHWPLHEMHESKDWPVGLKRVNERFYFKSSPSDTLLRRGGFDLPHK